MKNKTSFSLLLFLPFSRPSFIFHVSSQPFPLLFVSFSQITFSSFFLCFLFFVFPSCVFIFSQKFKTVSTRVYAKKFNLYSLFGLHCFHVLYSSPLCRMMRGLNPGQSLCSVHALTFRPTNHEAKYHKTKILIKKILLYFLDFRYSIRFQKPADFS